MKEQKVQMHEHMRSCDVCRGYNNARQDCQACGGRGLILDSVDRNYTAITPSTEGEAK